MYFMAAILLVSTLALSMLTLYLLEFAFSNQTRRRLVTRILLIALAITFIASVSGTWLLISRKITNGVVSHAQVRESTKAMVQRMYGAESEGLYIFTTGCEFLLAFEASMLVILNWDRMKSAYLKYRLTRRRRDRG